MRICPNCGFERRPIDEGIIPETECPKCGVIYSKVEKSASVTEIAKQGPLSKILNYQKYIVKKDYLEENFNVLNPQGINVLYAKLKSSKLRENICLYVDEDMRSEFLLIKPKDAEAFDVVDSATHKKLGALRKKRFLGLTLIEWILTDRHDCKIGNINEDKMALILKGRTAFNLVMEGSKVCSFQCDINPYIAKITVDLLDDTHVLFDKRLAIAAAILLCEIEETHNGHSSLSTGSSDINWGNSSGDSGSFGGGDSGGGGAGGDY